MIRLDTKLLELVCQSVHPDHGVGCTLNRGHEGPHQNPYRATLLEWENLGKGPCWCVAPDGSVGCLKDKGHDGVHQNGKDTWTETIPDPLA